MFQKKKLNMKKRKVKKLKYQKLINWQRINYYFGRELKDLIKTFK